MPNILGKIIKTSIYLLVFLTPLFFLPFTFEAFGFNKQYLLFFLVSIALLSWLTKMVICDREVRFRRSALDLFVLGFLFVAILSAVFSVDKTSSLFGFYGRFSDGLIGLLSLGIFYFLITNHVSLVPEAKQAASAAADKKSGKISQEQPTSIGISSIIRTFLWSVGFVLLFSFFSILGIWQKIGVFLHLPLVMLQRIFNPVAGSMEGLVVFLSIVMVLLVGLILCLNSKSKKIYYWLLLLASLILLIIIDFKASWIVAIATLILFVAFSIATRIFRENVNKLLLPVFLIVIAFVCLFTNFTNNILTPLPQEQVLNQGISFGVGWGAATENVKSGFLGSGIGTFSYDFAKQKPVEFNQNFLWQIRFDRAGDYFAEIIGTLGMLGILSYLALVGFFLMISWLLLQAQIKTDKSIAKQKYSAPLLMTFLALFVSQFVYYQNTILAFIFWLVLGLAVVSWQKPLSEKVISFKDFPELNLVFSTILIIFWLGVIGLYYFAGRIYLADIQYVKAQGMAVSSDRTALIEKMVRFNPDLALYRVILARDYLAGVREELSKPAAEQDSTKIQMEIAMAIDQAKKASEISPNSVATWENLGMIYRDIQSLAAGAQDWAIKSFEKAIALEPTNPVLYTELGKLYLSANQIPQARDNFLKAIELKPDYIDALIQDALTFEIENNLEKAIEKMENSAVNYPFNVDIPFQLGRLYFNNKQTDEAINQFQKVITLMPNHSNALYSLGVAYQLQGKDDLAIAEFEKVLELNPGNADVQAKLEELGK